MYRTIRKVHLYTSFVIVSFLLMYFLTGAVMVFDAVFHRMDRIDFSKNVPFKKDISQSEALAEICRQYNIKGDESIKQKNDGSKVYSFIRPGYKAEINFIKADTSALVEIRKGNFGKVMNDFHRLRGYKGDWTHMLWAGLYDLSCIALLIYAFSGVYLWWKLERKKLMGILFLLASTGLIVFTIWYIALIS